MIEEIDLQKLSTMTAFLKAESESASEFTIEFLECLIKRYNLDTALFEGIELEEVPEEIIKTIQEGGVPTQKDLLPMDSGEQNLFLMEMVWFAGMQRIAAYCEDEELEEGEPSTFDSILAMRDVSTAHWIGSYLIAALTLLSSKMPSHEFVDSLTNNFDESDDNVQRITNFFIETCGSIYYRYKEDGCFYDFKPEGDDNEGL